MTNLPHQKSKIRKSLEGLHCATSLEWWLGLGWNGPALQFGQLWHGLSRHLETTPFVYLPVTITTKTHIRTPRKQHTSIQRLGNHMHPLICSASPAMDVHSLEKSPGFWPPDHPPTLPWWTMEHFTAETTSEPEKHGRANRTWLS